MSGDIAVARKLVSEKGLINALERRGAENHMKRLRQGRPESIETSALHMDMLRDLRRIHSHIAAVAYPILDAAGELRASRLMEPSPEKPPPKTSVHHDPTQQPATSSGDDKAS